MSHAAVCCAVQTDLYLRYVRNRWDTECAQFAAQSTCTMTQCLCKCVAYRQCMAAFLTGRVECGWSGGALMLRGSPALIVHSFGSLQRMARVTMGQQLPGQRVRHRNSGLRVVAVVSWLVRDGMVRCVLVPRAPQAAGSRP